MGLMLPLYLYAIFIQQPLVFILSPLMKVFDWIFD